MGEFDDLQTAVESLPEGWVIVRRHDFEELQRWEVWGRVLRFMLLPIALGVGIGLALWQGIERTGIPPEVAMLGVVAVVLPWTLMQLRWVRRTQREMKADHERFMELIRG